MRLFGSSLVLGMALLASGYSAALAWQESAPKVNAQGNSAQIAKWIEQLGDADFETREKAADSLWRSGLAAEEALKKAQMSEDVETRRRAEEILGRFRLGIFPDSPKQVIDLAGEYNAADPSVRGPIMKKFLALGNQGLRALERLLSQEDKTLRAVMLDQFVQVLPGSLMALYQNKDLDAKALDNLLLLAGQYGQRGPVVLCAWATTTGQLKPWLELLGKGEGPFKGWDKKRALETKVWLARAAGDSAAALAAARELVKIAPPEVNRFGQEGAESLNHRNLLTALLMEQGNWAELNKLPLSEESDPGEKLGMKATFARLAGDKAGFEEAVRQLLDQAGRENEGDRVPYPARVLFINGKSGEAISSLSKSDARPAAFEIFAAQMRLKEAFDLAADSRKDNRHDQPLLDLLEAKTLYLLGEKKKGAALFDQYAAQLQAGAEPVWYESLIEQQVLAGRTDEACLHAANIFRLGSIDGWRTRLFFRLFGENQTDAEIWWQHLRTQEPEIPYEHHLKTMIGLLNGRIARDKLETELKSVEKALKAQPGHDGLRLAAAEAAHRAGLDAWEARLLQGGQRAQVSILLGDLHAGKKEWAKALEQYEIACKREPENTLAWTLQGKTMLQLAKQEPQGKNSQEWQEKGKRLEELALRLPLGDEAARSALVTALLKRGLGEEAMKHGAVLQGVSVPGTYQSGQAYRQLAQDAERREAFLDAARYQELGLLRCLSRQVSFVFPSAYVAVPAQVHRLKARGLLAKDDLDGAMAEMRACQKLMPRDVELPILMLEELNKRGKKSEADSLYQESLTAHENLLKAHPDCAWARNSAAWLMACCKRDLPRAVEHANKATVLSPQSAGYWDTLAEARFQNGDTPGAIEAQKKALDLEPKRVYYRRQLDRFQGGNKNAPRPPETLDD